MDDRYEAFAKITEQRVCNLLNQAGLTTEINNNDDPKAIDLSVLGHPVDVQFSFNFDQYGDVRFDLYSGFDWKQGKTKKEFLTRLKQGEPIKQVVDDSIENKKYGKFFADNQMQGVVYFLYEGSMPDSVEEFKKKPIAHMLYIPKDIIKQEIKDNIERDSKRLIINDKQSNQLNDAFNSAFIPYSLKYLQQKFDLPVADDRDHFLNEINDFIRQDFGIRSQKEEVKSRNRNRP